MTATEKGGGGWGISLWAAGGVGLIMATLQLLLLYNWRQPETLFGLYASLIQFDTFWYSDIARNGYRSALPPSGRWVDDSNIAFFPAYPLISGALHRLTGVGAGWALIIVSQLSAVIFWTALAVAFGRATRAIGVIFFACVIVASHPAAYFLMVPYSESLFLSSAMVFLLVITNPTGLTRSSYFLGALAGFAMTATRLTGLPVAAGGLLWGFIVRKTVRGGFAGLFSLVLISILGCVSFFAFCHYKWGVWNIYMQTQEAGWEVRTTWWAFLDPQNWFHLDLIRVWREFSEIGEGGQMPQYFNMFITSFYLWAMALAGLAEWRICLRRNSGWKDRVPYYAAAAGTMALLVTGLYSVEFRSMVRYSLVIHTLLVVPLILLAVETARAGEGDRRTWVMMIFGVILTIAAGFYLQSKIAKIFMAGGWTA